MVSSFVKEYLFPHYKFLKDGWMEYDDRPERLLTFVQGKVKIPEGVDYKDHWERVMSNHSSKVCHYKVQSQQ